MGKRLSSIRTTKGAMGHAGEAGDGAERNHPKTVGDMGRSKLDVKKRQRKLEEDYSYPIDNTVYDDLSV